MQHYQVVQMFSHALDLGLKYEPVGPIKNGFAWIYYNEPKAERSAAAGHMRTADGYYGYSKGGYWHPDFAWAVKRSAIDALGCLLDFCVVGSADWHMATCLIGEGERHSRDSCIPPTSAKCLNSRTGPTDSSRATLDTSTVC